MKNLKTLGLSAIIAYSFWVVDIYSISFTNIENSNVSISAYQGKKIMIMTLPIFRSHSNDSLLNTIDSIAGAYPTSLSVICVPSFEDGFIESNKESLKQWYRSFLRESIVISTGMYTRKASGNLQHPLFRWLTNKEQNGNMNKDVEGIGSKFFIHTDGHLLAVFSERVKLGNKYVHQTLQVQ